MNEFNNIIRARTEREVSLARGQLVVVAARLDTHWYLGRATGGSGQERMGLMPGETMAQPLIFIE